MRKSSYQWVATSPEGFVRHLVSYYLRHGYRFYVSGTVKPTRCVEEFDEVMERKFRYRMSRSWRNRRKQAKGPDGKPLGLANVHYLRYGRFWILLSTKGRHRFFDEHTKRNKWGDVEEVFFRDVHRDPIFFEGYSIRVAQGGHLPKRQWKRPESPEVDPHRRVRVQIAQETFITLKSDFIAQAKSGRWSVEELERAVWNLPFLPYAPIRQQLRDLVRWMNRARKERGFGELLDLRKCIRWKIPPVSAFAEAQLGGTRSKRTEVRDVFTSDRK